MADVTEADREKARHLLDTAPLLDLGGAIAAALAEEREKARAPFLELADRWYRMADQTPNSWDHVTLLSHAEHISRVAEETE